MTLFSLAVCIDCGGETIGGRGHYVDCKVAEPPPPLSRLELVTLKLAREQLIAQRSRVRR